MPAKRIRPHKGGRSQNVWIRATPETKAKLATIKAEVGLSAADVLEWGLYRLSDDPVALAKWLNRKTEEYIKGAA